MEASSGGHNQSAGILATVKQMIQKEALARIEGLEET